MLFISLNILSFSQLHNHRGVPEIPGGRRGVPDIPGGGARGIPDLPPGGRGGAPDLPPGRRGVPDIPPSRTSAGSNFEPEPVIEETEYVAPVDEFPPPPPPVSTLFEIMFLNL